MTDKKIVTLLIWTKGGSYQVPLVDIERHVLALDPVLSQNPCLQIINEEHGVLSLVWEHVTKIAAVYPSETNPNIHTSRVIWDSAV